MATDRTIAIKKGSAAHDQMLLYARDLKRAVDSERLKAFQLAEANARLRSLDRLKTDLLTFIAHELRTPLNALGAIHLLRSGDDSATQQQVLEIVRKGYERLAAFITKGLEYFNWLALGPVDRGDVLDVVDCVKKAIGASAGFRDPTALCRITLPEETCLVRGEATAIEGVVKILIDNAFKFSPGEKHVNVTASVAGTRVTVTVEDRGMGFAPEFATEIFKPFTVSNVKNYSTGSGLSLAISRLIVEAYGGTIRAHSPGEGRGATFVIDLAVAR